MVAAVMAATVMAAAGSCGGRLAGAGRVGAGRGLGQGLLPGALQHLQLQALLAATAPQGHLSFPGDRVHPGRLHHHSPLRASGTRWVLCGEAALSGESTLGGAQRCLSLGCVDLKLRLWLSTGIGLAGLAGFSYGQTAALWWQIVVMQAADVWRVAVLAGEGVRQ